MSETSDRLTPLEQREYILFRLNGWGFDEESLIEVSGMLDYFEKAVARAAFKEAAEVVRRFISVFPDPARGRIAPNALKPLANRLDRMAEASAKEGVN